MYDRKRLPQPSPPFFVTDGDIERCVSLHDGVDLPGLAAFDLLRQTAGHSAPLGYFTRYAELARSYGIGLVLDAPTARANADWAAILGYDTNERFAPLASALRGCYAP
jgi:hypothetical protein